MAAHLLNNIEALFYVNIKSPPPMDCFTCTTAQKLYIIMLTFSFSLVFHIGLTRLILVLYGELTVYYPVAVRVRT